MWQDNKKYLRDGKMSKYRNFLEKLFVSESKHHELKSKTLHIIIFLSIRKTM